MIAIYYILERANPKCGIDALMTVLRTPLAHTRILELHLADAGIKRLKKVQRKHLSSEEVQCLILAFADVLERVCKSETIIDNVLDLMDDKHFIEQVELAFYDTRCD